MTTTTVDIDDSRTLFADFTDDAGVATDPTGVTLTIVEPDGTVTTKTTGELSNPSVGRWEFVFAVAQAGRHFAHWAGTGAVTAAVNDEFYALRPRT